MFLCDFTSIRPPFETEQEKTFEWLAEAHAVSARDGELKKTIEEKLWHVGCKPDRIAKRGHVLADFLHTNWDQMDIYRLRESPAGQNLSGRMNRYSAEVEKIFEAFYPTADFPPDDLIHVSCTGYVSPSGAQKIVSQRGWGLSTTVTHAYHMGCYGSVPALRMARGFLASCPEKKQIDIVHTEVCSLHSNPSLHQLDQLVSQSLFADGFIKYSIARQAKGAHLKLLSIREEVIPDSAEMMTWKVSDWGFQMFLAKEVAVFITRHLPSYLSRLLPSPSPSPLFAVHPGGPKILVYIQKTLGLTDGQMAHSFSVLRDYGNMSSATLPHIWDRILKDPEVPFGTQIISLAFGPGLTICGTVMEKVCGS